MTKVLVKAERCETHREHHVTMKPEHSYAARCQEFPGSWNWQGGFSPKDSEVSRDLLTSLVQISGFSNYEGNKFLLF